MHICRRYIIPLETAGKEQTFKKEEVMKIGKELMEVR
jgi:hypothetical protein